MATDSGVHNIGGVAIDVVPSGNITFSKDTAFYSGETVNYQSSMPGFPTARAKFSTLRWKYRGDGQWYTPALTGQRPVYDHYHIDWNGTNYQFEIWDDR